MAVTGKNGVTNNVKYSGTNTFQAIPEYMHILSSSELPSHSHSYTNVSSGTYSFAASNTYAKDLTISDSNGNSYSGSFSSIVKHLKLELNLNYKPKRCYE
jgi:hypothetical protein